MHNIFIRVFLRYMIPGTLQVTNMKSITIRLRVIASFRFLYLAEPHNRNTNKELLLSIMIYIHKNKHTLPNLMDLGMYTYISSFNYLITLYNLNLYLSILIYPFTQ